MGSRVKDCHLEHNGVQPDGKAYKEKIYIVFYKHFGI